MVHTKLTLNVTLENRLAAFVAGLAISPRMLEHYRRDPEATMAEAALTEHEKEILRGGDWQVICELLGPDDTRPLPPISIDGG